MAAADVNVAVEGERAKTVGRTRSIVLSELPRHVSGLLEVYDTSATPQPSPQFVPNRLHSPQKKQPQFPAHPLWGCRGGASLGATRVARAPPVWPSSAPAARRVASPHRRRRRLRRKHHMAQLCVVLCQGGGGGCTRGWPQTRMASSTWRRWRTSRRRSRRWRANRAEYPPLPGRAHVCVSGTMSQCCQTTTAGEKGARAPEAGRTGAAKGKPSTCAAPPPNPPAAPQEDRAHLWRALLVAIFVLLLVNLATTFGVVYGVVTYAKDAVVNPSGLLLAKGNATLVVQTASADFVVTSSGGLASSADPNPATPTPLATIGATTTLALNSYLPDEARRCRRARRSARPASRALGRRSTRRSTRSRCRRRRARRSTRTWSASCARPPRRTARRAM